jgi:hypothetical protein
VTATAMTNRNAAIVVATALRRLLVNERAMGLALVKAVCLNFDDEAAPSRCRFCFMK